MHGTCRRTVKEPLGDVEEDCLRAERNHSDCIEKVMISTFVEVGMLTGAREHPTDIEGNTTCYTELGLVEVQQCPESDKTADRDRSLGKLGKAGHERADESKHEHDACEVINWNAGRQDARVRLGERSAIYPGCNAHNVEGWKIQKLQEDAFLSIDGVQTKGPLLLDEHIGDTVGEENFEGLVRAPAKRSKGFQDAPQKIGSPRYGRNGHADRCRECGIIDEGLRRL